MENLSVSLELFLKEVVPQELTPDKDSVRGNTHMTSTLRGTWGLG